MLERLLRIILRTKYFCFVYAITGCEELRKDVDKTDYDIQQIN